MMLHRILATLAIPAATVLSIAASSAARVQSSDEEMIREARTRSNRAIAAQDLPGIASAWMENVHIVSSTSAHATGRDANRQRMAQQFVRRPDTVYVRQATAVDLYSPWSVAAERGEWMGRWTEPDGALEIGGTYLAQWRKIGGRWLIQAELFVPTRCHGSQYCREHPVDRGALKPGSRPAATQLNRVRSLSF